jgi:hypothetical protein
VTFSNSITGAQGTLVRPAIKSPDYVPGVSGWAIMRDGTAEFNSGTFRGTVTAAEIIGSVFGSSLTDPSIWINEDDENTIRVYDAAGNVLLEAGVRPGSNASLTLTDPTTGWQTAIGAQIQWFQGSPVLSEIAALYQTTDGILLNTILAGGVAFDAVKAALKWVVPGSDTLETWHVVGSASNPAFNTNWVTNTTFNGSTGWPGLQFQRTANGRGALTGCWKAGATAPAAAIFQLPVGYRPAVNQPVWMERKTGSSPAVTTGFFGQVSTAGNVNVIIGTGGGLVAGDEFMIQTEYPLF